MLLALPFTTLDAKLMLALAKYMEFVGPYKSHEVILAAPADCEAYMLELQEILGNQFARVHLFTVTNFRTGWPAGCNQIFNTVAFHIWNNVPCDGWYFFEADNTPIKPNWLNTLSEEYRRVGRPFFGVIHGSYWRRKSGEFFQDGTHLVGTSIYPKNAPQYSKLFKSIPLAPVPWDVYWQWEIVKHAASTNLIQHEWRTIHYKRNPKTGEIKGERAPGVMLPVDARPLMPDAVVLHGCKDMSLMNIMRGLISSQAEPVSKPEEAAV